MDDEVAFIIDRHSFPNKCGELDDFVTLIEDNYPIVYCDTESPTYFFNRCIELVDMYDLVVPVTRNMFVRDRLWREGVTLVLSF